MDPERFKVNQPRPAYDQLPDLPPPPPPRYAAKPTPKHSKWWIWLLVVVFILIVGAVGLLVYAGHKTAKVTTKQLAKTPTQQVTIAPHQSVAANPPVNIPSSSHSSQTFGMTFNYPSSWNVVDSGNAGTTVTSPVMSLTAANGQQVEGQVVMNVAKQGVLPPAFTATSVAVLTSQIVNYTSPSPTQAADTYISFVQYPTTTTVGGLDGIYITGNYGYQKDQNIPSSDVAKVDPLIYFNFYSCSSSACPVSARQPLTIASSSWSGQTLSAPILMMIKSFTFN